MQNLIQKKNKTPEDNSLKALLLANKGKTIDKRLPESEVNAENSAEETSESEEEEDYDQENYNHFVKYQDPDSESERSFERERENMRKKYEDPDYSGGDDSEFAEDSAEEEDLEDLSAEEEKEIDEAEKRKKNKKKLKENEKEKTVSLEKEKKNSDAPASTLQNNHCEIYVDNLPFNKHEIEIKNFFAKLNKNVVFVKLLKDEQGISKGRAFVKFRTYNDALSIINEGDISMEKRKLRVSLVDKDRRSKGKEDSTAHEKNEQSRKQENKKTPEKFNNDNNNKTKNYELELNSDKHLTNYKNKNDFKNNQSNTVFVKNLPDDVEEAKLKKLFKKFGKIANIRLLKKLDGSIKNFGYIDFENGESVDEAVKLGRLRLDQNDLIIEKAKSSFNQNVFNDSKTIAKKRKREQAERERKTYEKQQEQEAGDS